MKPVTHPGNVEQIQIKVTLTIREKSQTPPGEQIRKFGETMVAGSCELAESGNREIDKEDRQKGTFLWQRTFKAGKKQRQMLKTARNLLERAGEYSDIQKLYAEIFVGDNPPEYFTWGSAQSSDYFKEKSWK